MEPMESFDPDMRRRMKERLSQTLLQEGERSEAKQDPTTVWVRRERRRLRAKLQQLLDESSILAAPSASPITAETDFRASEIDSAMIAQLREPPGLVWEEISSRRAKKRRGE